MRRRLEALLPVVVLAGFLVAAVVVNLLLTSAQARGVHALEDSIEVEVEAVAASQDQRFANTFDSAAGLANPAGAPYAIETGSAADRERLETLLQLLPDVRSGFYLLDARDRVTQGVQLLDEGSIGQPFEWPGYEALRGSATFAQGRGGVLPVAEGLTTDEPVLALVIPVLDPGTGARRGAFVFESVVAADSDFNQEIGPLGRGDTGEYLFYDDAGAVVAASDPTRLGQVLRDERLRTAPVGVQRFGDQVVALAEVPSAGWRVAFRQDAEEFEEPLVGPLATAGRVLVVVLLAAGGLLTVLLQRRLRAARAEQARLRQLGESQQELISIVSHELRTPVAGVLGFLETTLDHWDDMSDDERRSALGRAAANAQRLQSMTRDVLDTQSVEQGRLVHVLQPLDLAAEVRVAIDAARALAPDRRFVLDGPDEPVWVQGDADRLHQVLANLLDNAQRSSPVVEPIEVTVAATGSEAEVQVRDHGAGIAEEALERIFDKFVRERGDSVRGTGLGLYIARQVLEAHGGRIWAESPPGAGATFRFTIPTGPPAEPKL